MNGRNNGLLERAGGDSEGCVCGGGWEGVLPSFFNLTRMDWTDYCANEIICCQNTQGRNCQDSHNVSQNRFKISSLKKTQKQTLRYTKKGEHHHDNRSLLDSIFHIVASGSEVERARNVDRPTRGMASCRMEHKHPGI